MDSVRHVLFHAPSRDPFFDRPAAIENAVRACLPPGFSLVVADDASALVTGLREAVAYVGWAFPPSLAKRAKRLRYAYFLQAGVPEAFAHATNAAGDPIAVDTSVGVNARSVADHALFFLLAWCRGVRSDSFARGWDAEAFDVARDPRRLDVVVYGYGHVARAIGTLFAPLVRSVRFVSRTARAATPDEPEVTSFDDARPIVAGADVIVLALPATSETRTIFDGAWLESLRADVAILNVARGELLDEGALLAFLETHPDARCFADVAVPEPYPADGALRAAPEVVLTPHLGGRREDIVSLHAAALEGPLRAALLALVSP